MRSDETKANQPVRTDRPGRNRQQQVAHQSEHSVVGVRRVAEEIRRVADVLLEAEQRAGRPERDTPVGALLLAVPQADAVLRIAAEVVADEG